MHQAASDWRSNKGHVSIWDYPSLAQVLYGCTSTLEATTSSMCVWSPETVAFNFVDMYSPIYAITGYNFILVRHKCNLHAPGLGDYIGQLEEQTRNPIQVSAAIGSLTRRPDAVFFAAQNHPI